MKGKYTSVSPLFPCPLSSTNILCLRCYRLHSSLFLPLFSIHIPFIYSIIFSFSYLFLVDLFSYLFFFPHQYSFSFSQSHSYSHSSSPSCGSRTLNPLVGDTRSPHPGAPCPLGYMYRTLFSFKKNTLKQRQTPLSTLGGV